MKSERGEATDRAALSRRLAELGVKAADPYCGTRVQEAYLMLTMDCNIRCRACSLWGVGGACHDGGYHARAQASVPLARMLTFIDELHAAGVAHINLSGGEPLLTTAWRPLAERARQRGTPIAMTTNGVLLEENADDVAALLDQVNISVACRPDDSARLRAGPRGHYEAMTRGLRRLCALRDAAAVRKPRLRLLLEVFDSNADQLGGIIEHLSGSGIEFDEIFFQHLISNAPSVLAEQEAVVREEFGCEPGLWRGYGYRGRNMDYQALDEALAELRRRHPRARFSVDLRGAEALKDYYEGERRSAGDSFCDAPWSQINVLPNGDVWVCPDVSLGSMREVSFAQIWDGPAARALRRRVSERLMPACRGCFYFYGKNLAPTSGGSRG